MIMALSLDPNQKYLTPLGFHGKRKLWKNTIYNY